MGRLDGRNPHTGDPTDPLVGRVAAILAGNDHVAWLSMSQATRETWYKKAEEVISVVRQSEWARLAMPVEPPNLITKNSNLTGGIPRQDSPHPPAGSAAPIGDTP